MKGNTMKFERTVTKSGAPLFVFSMPHVENLAVGVLVNAGTRDEVWPKEAGIAHALEHMVFQGNARLFDSLSVSSEIETIGGMLNAWTTKEMTLYYNVVPKDSLQISADSIGSMLNTSLFRPENIATEMKNVVQEIKRANDSPDGFCRDMFEEVLYGQHPLGKRTLGTEESVLAFGRNDFLAFMKRLYYPKNCTFIVVGNTTLEEAEKAFDSAFPSAHGPNTKHAREHASSIVSAKKHGVFERDIKQANVCLGVTIGAGRDLDTEALEFFKAMIDGGMSFPLFQEVRDKRGLCYSIGADITPWSDCGQFQIYVGTNAETMDEAIHCIHEVMKNSSNDAHLFARAKTYLLGSTAISFTSPAAILQHAATDIAFLGTPRSPAEIRNDIEKQTPEGVLGAVQKHLLDPASYSYAYVVPPGTKISYT
ncbi:MAG TPA: pitrilysin family protein [Candidatus Paceibacterota bacterium]